MIPGGLYHYRSRFYEPATGRFLSEDPIGFNGGINFYAYVGNNPINANDPMGEVPIPLITGIVGSAAGAVGSAVGQVVNNGFNDFSFSEVAVAAGVGFVAGAAAPFTATTLVGATITGSVANVAQLGINEAVSGDITSVVPRDVAIAGATGAIGGAVGGAIVRSSQIGFDTFSDALDQSVVNTIHKEAILPLSSAVSSFGRNVIGSVVSNLEVEIPNGISASNQAAGGFVLYPNKRNLNSLESVYSK